MLQKRKGIRSSIVDAEMKKKFFARDPVKSRLQIVRLALVDAWLIVMIRIENIDK